MKLQPGLAVDSAALKCLKMQNSVQDAADAKSKYIIIT
jgi:hypothetical protein